MFTREGSGFIRADANVATATLRPLSKGQLGGQQDCCKNNNVPIDQRSIGSCVNSALPPKVKTSVTTIRDTICQQSVDNPLTRRIVSIFDAALRVKP
ncbi:MAG: hypothetical protein Q7S22_07905 [Candidatus Micrarchaeota archaeon]|nr:hypothetical protein [Candidatus Micrarchaeota archaeon]